jgi:hypothetical protein
LPLTTRDVITSPLLYLAARGFNLGVQGVHQRDRTVEVQTPKGGLGGGVFVALAGHRFDAQGRPLPASMAPTNCGAAPKSRTVNRRS